MIGNEWRSTGPGCREAISRRTDWKCSQSPVEVVFLAWLSDHRVGQVSCGHCALLTQAWEPKQLEGHLGPVAFGSDSIARHGLAPVCHSIENNELIQHPSGLLLDLNPRLKRISKVTSIQWCCCKMETFLQMLLPNPLRFATPSLYPDGDSDGETKSPAH